MDFRDLEYVIVIAREKNLSKAAERLYISQPALSRFLLRLENRLGTPLFTRKKRQYVPTYAGELYLDMAKRVLEAKQGFDAELSRFLRPQAGSISIGTTPGRGCSTLPEVLPAFREIFPDYELKVYEEDAETLEQHLISGAVRLAFFPMTANSRRYPQNIRYDCIGREEIVLCTPAQERFLQMAVRDSSRGYPVMPLTAVENETFLCLKKSTRLGQLTGELLEKYRISPRTMEVGSIETALALVGRGYGVSFAPGFRIEERFSARGAFVFSFGGEPEGWDIVAARPSGDELDGPARYLVKLIEELYRNGAKKPTRT